MCVCVWFSSKNTTLACCLYRKEKNADVGLISFLVRSPHDVEGEGGEVVEYFCSSRCRVFS